MNNEFELYNASLDFLGIKFDKNTFQDRIKLQKIAYLLGKVFKWKFINNFNFYIRGPYSTELTAYYYSKEHTLQTNVSITDKMKNRLKSLYFLKDLSVEMLEIIASLDYLQQKNKELDEEVIEEQLKNIKPYLDIKKIWRGTQLLKQFKLTKEDAVINMEDLKEELDGWDKASSEDFEKLESNSV